MDNKNFNDGWNPTEYEVYSKEGKPFDVKYDGIYNKPENKRKKKNILPAVIVAICAIILVLSATVMAVVLHGGTSKETKDNNTAPSQAASVRITFPEGYTVYQMAELLEQNKVCSKEDFYKAANKPVDGIEITNGDERVFLLEGYLFPDTYDFYVGEDADSVIKRFIDNFNSKVTPEMKAKAEESGYTFDEMITLASIIQKECDLDLNECKNVSSVFHNRLDNSRQSYLGSDVTYFYLKNMADYLGGSDSEKFDDYLTKYYTYQNYRKGLPAGAVCCPGMKAIEAALYPNDTDYQYFLTDESMTKFFYAETYGQHQQNAVEAGITG